MNFYFHSAFMDGLQVGEYWTFCIILSMLNQVFYFILLRYIFNNL